MCGTLSDTFTNQRGREGREEEKGMRVMERGTGREGYKSVQLAEVRSEQWIAKCRSYDHSAQ